MASDNIYYSWWQVLTEWDGLTSSPLFRSAQSPDMTVAAVRESPNASNRASSLLRQEIKQLHVYFLSGCFKVSLMLRLHLFECAHVLRNVKSSSRWVTTKRRGRRYRIPKKPFWLPNLSILTRTLICEAAQSLSKQPVPVATQVKDCK